MEFYGIVVIIASIVLIMCLIIVGILMQNMSEDGNFPPVASPCPDNWTVLGNTCVVPAYDSKLNVGELKNIVNHGPFIAATPGITNSTYTGATFVDLQTPTTYVDFNHADWKKSGPAICKQREWTTQYGITWDGVSNATGCPN
jgi:hypothetical protein